MKTSTRSMFALLCLAASGAGGWWARGPGDVPAPAATAPSAARPAIAAGAQVEPPLIAVSGDGQVTLRVEQQPLDWVLDEIARQSGLTDVRRRDLVAAAAAAASAASGPGIEPAQDCPVAAAAPRAAEVAQLLHAIERGTDADREQGLLAARNEGVALPAATLRQVWETDGSDHVRLVAFEAWLEQFADRPDAVREALVTAASMPGEALPREARRRLEDLVSAERGDPSDSQSASTAASP